MPQWYSFCSIHMYQIRTLYTLNLPNVRCQLYRSKAGGRDTVRAGKYLCPHILSMDTFLCVCEEKMRGLLHA